MNFSDKIIEFFSEKDNSPIWKQFATSKNGELKSTSGDLFVDYIYTNLNFSVGEFTHYVNSGGKSYEKKYMIGIVIFSNPTSFELSITPDDLFAKLGKLFKNEDIIIENKNFDSKFYVKSNNKLKAISILRDKVLSEKINSLNPTLLEITKDKALFNEHNPPNGKFMLYFAKQERLKDVNQLNSIHILLTTFIEKLRENNLIQN